MNTYLITYLRTAFDVPRTFKVYADNEKNAKQSLRDVESARVIINSVTLVKANALA